ncbi:MAG: hypothetical protein AAF721_37625 [Myxococcota bacterium]
MRRAPDYVAVLIGALLTRSIVACGASSWSAAGSDGPDPTGGGAETGSSGAGGGSDGIDLPLPPSDCEEGTVVDGWLNIDGTVYDERESLRGISVVDGDVVVDGAPDADLSFLACVREITGDLYLHDNANLTDVSGLHWVERIGGDIIIADNERLTNFDALTLITELGTTELPDDDDFPPPWPLQHSLFIIGNPALVRVDGLARLTSVHGNLIVRDNPSLAAIDGLVGITGIGLDLAINHNASLCLSRVNILGEAIVEPEAPRDSWTTLGNDPSC